MISSYGDNVERENTALVVSLQLKMVDSKSPVNALRPSAGAFNVQRRIKKIWYSI